MTKDVITIQTEGVPTALRQDAPSQDYAAGVTDAIRFVMARDGMDPDIIQAMIDLFWFEQGEG